MVGFVGNADSASQSSILISGSYGVDGRLVMVSWMRDGDGLWVKDRVSVDHDLAVETNGVPDHDGLRKLREFFNVNPDSADLVVRALKRKHEDWSKVSNENKNLRHKIYSLEPSVVNHA